MTHLDPFNLTRADAPADPASIVDTDSEDAEPIAKLIARWRSAVAAYDEERRDTDQEVDAFVDETFELMAQVTKISAVNMRDLAAKAEIARNEMRDVIAGGPIYPWQALILSLFDDIQRLAAAAAMVAREGEANV